MFVHDGCLSKAIGTCQPRPVRLRADPMRLVASYSAYAHHWVLMTWYRPIPTGGQCASCSLPLSSSCSGRVLYRCSLCAAMVHQGCALPPPSASCAPPLAALRCDCGVGHRPVQPGSDAASAAVALSLASGSPDTESRPEPGPPQAVASVAGADGPDGAAAAAADAATAAAAAVGHASEPLAARATGAAPLPEAVPVLPRLGTDAAVADAGAAAKADTAALGVAAAAAVVDAPAALPRLDKAVSAADVVLHMPSACCVIALVNYGSGPRMGPRVACELRRLLGPARVYSMSERGPVPPVLEHLQCPGLRVLVCGGDGTVGWILSELARSRLAAPPPVAVLPLGTGNDLSRCFGWGPGYTAGPLEPWLRAVAAATPVRFDRWQVDVVDPDARLPLSGLAGRPLQMNNYLSVGYDALVTYQFEVFRQEHRQLTSSRAMNKLIYAMFGAKAAFVDRVPVADVVDVEIDGQPLALPRSLRAVVVLNLQSYAAGVDMWARGRGALGCPPRTDDGLLEVVGVDGPANMLNVMSGCGRCLRLGQARQVVFRSRADGRTVPMQIDGEGMLLQERCEVRIVAHEGTAWLLRRTHGS